jgi:hypothetical protein
MGRFRAVAINLIVHALAVAAFVIISNVAHIVHLAWLGEFGSRGIAPGAAIRLTLLVLIITNFLIAVVTSKTAKLVLIFLYIAIEAWFLFPSHPLRAILYCSAGAIISLIAVYSSAAANSMICKLMKKRHV